MWAPVGIEADSDKALFPLVDCATRLGADGSIQMDFPVFTGAVGSTDIARINWEDVAVGAAISGVIVVAGENICGMDPQAEFKNGKIEKSPEMERRINSFRRWYDGKGGVIVQANVEDTKLGVPEYVIGKLGVEIFELKWGQGAKDIGGEVKLPSLERALQLKERGYIVLPDPRNRAARRHSSTAASRSSNATRGLEWWDEEGFYKEAERLRKIGAKYVTLKTGAYRPVDLARAIKFSSEAKIDLLTIDGAGGGTGMSPWRMMNEWGIPTVSPGSPYPPDVRAPQSQGRIHSADCDRRRTFARRSHLQGAGPGRSLCQGHMPRPRHSCRGDGWKNPRPPDGRETRTEGGRYL